MAEIRCIRGEVALVDEEDLEKASPYGWYVTQTSRKAGKPKLYVSGYIRGAGRPALYLHRLILDAPKGTIVDHIDGNTLDCRKCNLRLVTHGQNAHNRMPNTVMAGKPCASKFKGVSWDKKSKAWRTQIGFQRVLYRKLFDDEIVAAEAYDDLSYWLHGEFGYRNFPERQPRELRGTFDVKGVRQRA